MDDLWLTGFRWDESSVMDRTVSITLLLCCLLVACSGLQGYRGDTQKNLYITTNTESHGWLSSVDAALDIYQMPDGCNVDYQGTVQLDHPLVEVGVPQGVPAYLVFRVESSEFLSNTQRTLGYDFALYPEYGQVYDVNVVYRDNVYDVEVAERPRGATDGQRLAVGMVERDCGGENS